MNYENSKDPSIDPWGAPAQTPYGRNNDKTLSIEAA